MKHKKWRMRKCTGSPLGEATGRQQKSGFGVYPEYHFDARRLKELERGGCEGYAAGLQQRGRSAKSNSRPVR